MTDALCVKCEELAREVAIREWNATATTQDFQYSEDIKRIYREGFEVCYALLTTGELEFDNNEARDYAEGLEHIQHQGATYTFADGARWQFDKLHDRILSLDIVFSYAKLSNQQFQEYITELENKNAKLQDKMNYAISLLKEGQRRLKAEGMIK